MTMALRAIVLSGLLPSLALAQDQPTTVAPPVPLVGAIRWDAWHGDQGEPGRAVQRALGPPEYRHRLPAFATVRGADDVLIDGTSQDVMDKEIDDASRAGLAYWAFVTYDENDAMSVALARYLSSTRRDKIKFSLIVEAGRLRSTTYRARLVSLLAAPGYLQIGSSRPVLYLGFLNEEELVRQWGSVAAFGTAIDDLRAELRRVGVGDPYLVIMDFTPEQGKKWAEAVGAQALSSYAAHGDESVAPFRRLAQYAEDFWDACRATGAEVVPIIMSGWDRRPRIARPVPWEQWQRPGVGMDKYYEAATPAELAAHTGRALSWMRQNPLAAPAQLALIYAWNEHDEGGWLTPTLTDGSSRLDALAPVLK